ncbi:MAG: NUDIX hydrolase [Acidobacteriia bacterium]|jgi:ADP-ribose pyrophosphatase|nr:NUDIX hydrolase [Terriglobia bacterium]
MKVQVNKHELEYSGFIKIEKSRLRFEKFNGTMSEEVTRYRHYRGDAVAVIIFDSLCNQVLLIQQFRYAVHARTSNGWLVECVAGMQEKGENLEDVAHREVYEETGLKLTSLNLMTEYFYSPGSCSDKVHIFLGTVKNSEQTTEIHGLSHEGEDIKVWWVSLETALAMCDANEIQDAKTIVGLNLLARRIQIN